MAQGTNKTLTNNLKYLNSEYSPNTILRAEELNSNFGEVSLITKALVDALSNFYKKDSEDNATISKTQSQSSVQTIIKNCLEGILHRANFSGDRKTISELSLDSSEGTVNLNVKDYYYDNNENKYNLSDYSELKFGIDSIYLNASSSVILNTDWTSFNSNSISFDTNYVSFKGGTQIDGNINFSSQEGIKVTNGPLKLYNSFYFNSSDDSTEYLEIFGNTTGTNIRFLNNKAVFQAKNTNEYVFATSSYTGSIEERISAKTIKGVDPEIILKNKSYSNGIKFKLEHTTPTVTSKSSDKEKVSMFFGSSSTASLELRKEYFGINGDVYNLSFLNSKPYHALGLGLYKNAISTCDDNGWSIIRGQNYITSSSENAHGLELATGSNGKGKIVANQYNGTTVIRSLTLMDENGDTTLSGKLNLPSHSDVDQTLTDLATSSAEAISELDDKCTNAISDLDEKYTGEVSEINTRLDSLGFKEGVLTYSTNIGEMSIHGVNSLKKQGNYCICNFKLGLDVILSYSTEIVYYIELKVPNDFLPAEPVKVQYRFNQEYSSSYPRTLSIYIGTDGVGKVEFRPEQDHREFQDWKSYGVSSEFPMEMGICNAGWKVLEKGKEPTPMPDPSLTNISPIVTGILQSDGTYDIFVKNGNGIEMKFNCYIYRKDSTTQYDTVDTLILEPAENHQILRKMESGRKYKIVCPGGTTEITF